ncbi:hypothetical protein C8Q79DRAFT_905157 [Trametes meyenii]|nr:hypothetical protein C8Q79DRAFT_905157 [Trametes meyenii]
MSGTNLVDSAEDAGARPPTGVSEDQAASLRAAALMTLKLKRRKATISQAEPMLLHRAFVAPPTIELDYGQEETAGPSSLASSPAVAPVKPTKPLPSDPAPMEVDDGATREEGEISDSEIAPSTPNARSEPKSPVLTKTSSIVRGQPKQPHDSTPPSVAVLPQDIIAPQASVPSMAFHVDENHVRPGLALTQAQYDTAKDIVLDLLGWGVPPEYLVSCGLSRALVYYVFVELNLRLPSNLDTIGLATLPSPSSPQLTPSPANLPRPSLSHPSLPPKPQSQTEVGSVGANVLHPLSAAATPFVPAGLDAIASTASPGANLHDMEQQRKQELLARKAVLASRRPKPKAIPAVASSSRMTSRHTPAKDDQIPNGSIPTKLVDDFLQSIEPVVSPSASSSGQATPLPGPSRSIYDMDIEDVPGLTATHVPITEYTPLPRPPPPAPLAKSNIASPRSPPVPQSAVSTASEHSFHNPSSVPGLANSSLYDDDMDAIPGLFQARSLPDDGAGNPRRGTKRPVAADFVDMEPGPAKTQPKGPPDFFRATIRRKTAGFAGLTQRRCVIDLSDSDDDEPSEPRFNGIFSRPDSRGPKENPQPTTIPTPRTRSPVMTPSITPATLHEKEEEIRRMRELIALRELRRKKKPIASTHSTPTSSSTPTNGTVSVKQEDDDSAGVHSFGSSRSGSSATPDPIVSGRRYDSQDERSVLDTLLPHGV